MHFYARLGFTGDLFFFVFCLWHKDVSYGSTYWGWKWIGLAQDLCNCELSFWWCWTLFYITRELGTYDFVINFVNEQNCVLLVVLCGAFCVIITRKRSVFQANCAKLQPHVDCDKLHAVDCNLPLVSTDQTCINMFISSKHDSCVRPRACYFVVIMLVLNSHLLHCPLLLDSLTRGPARQPVPYQWCSLS